MAARQLDEEGRQASTVRLLKATLARDLKALEKAAGSLEKLAQALLFAAIPPLVFIGTVGAANFKPDMPSPLGKMVVGFIWHIAAWASLITFLA